MKLIIAGGRNVSLAVLDVMKLDVLHGKHIVTEVVHGGCSGVDSDAAAWAALRKIPARVFPADWTAHGKAAGPIRNAAMAAYADAVALFPGGRGTQSMFNEAKKAGLTIFDFR